MATYNDGLAQSQGLGTHACSESISHIVGTCRRAKKRCLGLAAGAGLQEGLAGSHGLGHSEQQRLQILSATHPCRSLQAARSSKGRVTWQTKTAGRLAAERCLLCVARSTSTHRTGRRRRLPTPPAIRRLRALGLRPTFCWQLDGAVRRRQGKLKPEY